MCCEEQKRACDTSKARARDASKVCGVGTLLLLLLLLLLLMLMLMLLLAVAAAREVAAAAAAASAAPGGCWLLLRVNVGENEP